MAAITTSSMFVGDINIPDAANISLFIDKYEPKFLTAILGYKTAKDLFTDWDANAASGKWFNLWNGVEYTDKHGRLNKWPGFLDVGYSAIAFYIYTRWMKDVQSNTGTTGEVRSVVVGADPVSAADKVSNAWNQMCELLYVLDDYLVQNASDYPDYIGATYWCETYGNKQYYDKINSFGI